MWNDLDFADVTLATADYQQIRAHKVILSSCSQFFRNILLNNPHQNPLLYLKGIKHRELVLVTQFIYLGQCQAKHENVGAFLATGKDLEVSGLMEGVDTDYIIETDMVNTTEQDTSHSLRQVDTRTDDVLTMSSNVGPVRKLKGNGNLECDQCGDLEVR